MPSLGELGAADALAKECDAMAAASRDRQARDDQRVGDFRAQLDETLREAHAANQRFAHRNEPRPPHAAASSFFDARIQTLGAEAASLRQQLARLEEALAPSAGHGYGGASGMNGHGNGHGATVEGTAVLLRDQLRDQSGLFGRAAARLTAQHARLDGHRAAIRAALGHDPFAEAAAREAAAADVMIIDKYKPPEDPTPALAVPSTLPAPAAAPGTTPMGGAPALTAGGFGLPAAAGANPFGAPRPAGALGLTAAGTTPSAFGMPAAAAPSPFAAAPAPAAGGCLLYTSPSPRDS